MSNENSQLSSHKSALIAMSGGVDSTVAALLTLRDGLDCAGATMMLFPGGEKTVSEAKAVANTLNIPFHACDFTESFTEYVILPFIQDYREGRTPNPCVVCNKHLKFGKLLDKAFELNKDCVVTGHYAQIGYNIETGRYLVRKGTDLSKDQSYVLYSLTQNQLSRIRLPLGGLTKTQVREIAYNEGIESANKSESQDICFIPDGNYVGFIENFTGVSPDKGRFIDINGNDLGESNGISSYTIGQRRGLGLSMPHPPYVIEIRPEENTVVVGREEMLYSKSFYTNNINLIPFDKLEKPIRAHVKIRYSDPGHLATVEQVDTDSLHIEFDEPKRAITKGQAAVIYDGDHVVGGGTII